MFVIRNKNLFIGISVTLVILAIVSISVFGLKLGIDFKGGALAEVEYPQGRPDIGLVKEKLSTLNIGDPLVQPTGEKGYFIKTRDLTEPERASLFQALSLDNKYEVIEKSFTSIGPSVGNELRRKSIIAIILVMIAIILFIAFSFRQVSRPVSSWKYGIIAVLALLHDITIPTGIFALLGKYTNAEVDTLFVVALLTILGLSVSDTIVVFDRIRENQRLHTAPTFAETVGRSLSQTYNRSINTSLTVILVLLALLFFGPESTRWFALVLAIGMFFGTYSSIFLASPLLVLVEERQKKRK